MMHSYQQSRQPKFPMTFLFPTNEGCRENPPAERLVISVNTGTKCAQVPPTLRKSDSCFCTQKQVAGHGARENPDRRVGRGSLAPFPGQQRIGQLGALSAPLTPPDRPREPAPGSGGPSMGRKRARAPGRELLPSKAASRATPNLKCYWPERSGDLSPFKGPPLGIKRPELPLLLTAGNCSHPHTKNPMQALHVSPGAGLLQGGGPGLAGPLCISHFPVGEKVFLHPPRYHLPCSRVLPPWWVTRQPLT